METQRPNVRVGIGVYVCHEGELLIFERITADHAPNTWTPPGGHLENGEHWLEGALREVAEECEVDATDPHLFAVTNDVFPETGKHYVTMHVAVKAKTKHFVNKEPHKHQNCGWYKWEDVPQPRFRCLQSVYDQGLKPTYLNEKTSYAA